MLSLGAFQDISVVAETVVTAHKPCAGKQPPAPHPRQPEDQPYSALSDTQRLRVALKTAQSSGCCEAASVFPVPGFESRNLGLVSVGSFSSGFVARAIRCSTHEQQICHSKRIITEMRTPGLFRVPITRTYRKTYIHAYVITYVPTYMFIPAYFCICRDKVCNNFRTRARTCKNEPG